MVYYHKFSGNKFKNVKQECGGVRYDSKKEANKAAELNLLKKAGKIKDWAPHWKIPINAVYIRGSELPYLTAIDGLELKKRGEDFDHICNYYVDFKIEHNDGSVEYLEIKSPITMTPVWKLKWRLCEIIFKDHPVIFLRVES